MADYVDYVQNMADPPPWADTTTDEMIEAGTIGPVAADLATRLAERDGYESEPASEAP